MDFKNVTPLNKIAEVEQEVSMALARVAYFISPKVVQRLVELNLDWKSEFELNYGSKVNLDQYFYKNSACLFPGVRRPASEEERKLAKGPGRRKYHKSVNAILDDNIYPRHLWCFLSTGQPYTGPTWRDSGLGQFELAHVLPHKSSELKGVKDWFVKVPSGETPYGLFSCAANIILLPKGMARPTDGTAGIRLAVLKHYFDLYGDLHSGGFSGLTLPNRMTWYGELKWNASIEPQDWENRIARLDDFRRKGVSRLLASVTA